MISKKMQVVEALSRRIMSGEYPYGAQLPTQRELCEEFKTVRSCLHTVFNILMEKQLIERRPGKGIFAAYKPDDCVRLENVGLIVADIQRMKYKWDDNYGLDIIWGVEEKLQELGIGCQILRVPCNSFGRIANWIQKFNIDGLILDRYFVRENLTDRLPFSLPVVFAGGSAPFPYCSVIPDYYNTMYRFIQQIHRKGIRKVGLVLQKNFFYSSDMISVSMIASQELPGLKLEIYYYNEDIPPKIDSCPEVSSIIKKILKNDNLPELFICQSDYAGEDVLLNLQANGIKVPEQTGIVSFIGQNLGAELEPALTTFKVNAMELGNKSVNVLMQLADKERLTVTTVPFRYIERDSFKL